MIIFYFLQGFLICISTINGPNLDTYMLAVINLASCIFAIAKGIVVEIYPLTNMYINSFDLIRRITLNCDQVYDIHLQISLTLTN